MTSLVRGAGIAGWVAAALWASVAGAAEESIRIGVPLELSGRFVAFGTSGARGVEMAVDAFHGKVAGKKVEILLTDIQSDPQVAVAAMNELTGQKKVKYVFGPIASAMVSSVIPAWKQNKPVWIVNGSAAVSTETAVGDEPRFFHTFPYSYHYQTAMSAALKHYIGSGKPVSIVYTDDAYGRASLPLARKYFTEAGFKIVSEDLIRSGASDYNPVLSRVRLNRPEVLINLVQTTDLANLAKQIQIAALNVPYLTDGIDILQEEWMKAVGDAQEGWIGVAGYFPGMTHSASKSRPDLFPSLADWEAKYRQRYKTDPAYMDVCAYSAMNLLLMAMDKAGDDPDKVVAELEKIDTETYLGRGRFIATGSGTLHQAFQELLVVQHQAGKTAIVYPLDRATGKLIARGVK